MWSASCRRERERELLSGVKLSAFGVTGVSLLYGLTKNIPVYAGSSFLTFPFAGSSFITRTKKITEFLTLSRFYFGRGKPLCLPSADENLVR